MSNPKLGWFLSYRKFKRRLVDSWDKPLSNPFQRFTQFTAILGVLTSVYFAYRTIKLTEETKQLTIKYGDNKDQLNKLTDLVTFSQKQEAYKNHLDSVARKVNIIKLRKANRSLFEYAVSNMSNEDRIEFLSKIGIVLEREMENPVLLDDDTISRSWINTYSELVNTREDQNAILEHWSTTKIIKGKEVLIRTPDALQEYKDQSFHRFLKVFNKFQFDFELFMKVKNKEIGILFD